MKVLRSIIAMVVVWYNVGIIGDLLLTRGHSSYLGRHRTTAIINRLRIVSAAFAAPTILWIGLDATALDQKSSMTLAVLRLVIAFIFCEIAAYSPRNPSVFGAISILVVTIACPLIIYAAAEFIIGYRPGGALAAIDLELYRYIPFIVLAGLTVFPLVLAEGLAIACPIIMIGVAIPSLQNNADWIGIIVTAWPLMLLLGVCLLVQLNQLHYMMVLLGRASYDPLTGVFTRRSGVEMIEFQFRLSCERKLPLSIAFFDIDNFKGINDTFGHEEGDRVLKAAAQTLATLVRQGDLVIRWGGEEFIVVLPNVTSLGAELPVRRILNEWLGTRPDGTPLTASIGVAERLADETEDWSSLVELADKRMYEAKTSGKARCMFAESVTLLPDGNIKSQYCPGERIFN